MTHTSTQEIYEAVKEISDFLDNTRRNLRDDDACKILSLADDFLGYAKGNIDTALIIIKEELGIKGD